MHSDACRNRHFRLFGEEQIMKSFIRSGRQGAVRESTRETAKVIKIKAAAIPLVLDSGIAAVLFHVPRGLYTTLNQYQEGKTP